MIPQKDFELRGSGVSAILITKKWRKNEMKKMVMVLACVMVLSAFAMSNDANAAPPTDPGWYNCAIVTTGAFTVNAYFMLVTSNDGIWANNRVFLIDGSGAAGKSMLATALTAYSNGASVALYMPTTQAAYTYPEAVVAGLMP
jgi:hypothetical protein